MQKTMNEIQFIQKRNQIKEACQTQTEDEKTRREKRSSKATFQTFIVLFKGCSIAGVLLFQRYWMRAHSVKHQFESVAKRRQYSIDKALPYTPETVKDSMTRTS